MPIERINSQIETHHNSFMENITNYAQQLYKNKNISKAEFIQIQSSLADHNVKDLLWLSAKMLAVEKPLDLVQGGFVGKAAATGGAFATWGVAEGIKSAALMGVIANDKKYTGSKTLLYPFAAIPGVGALAPFGVLYKDHRALFRLVRGYLFNRQRNYQSKPLTPRIQKTINNFSITSETIPLKNTISNTSNEIFENIKPKQRNYTASAIV